MPMYKFTFSELAKAGLLFHPESRVRADTLVALRNWRLVEDVMNKRNELLGELNAARSHARVCSAQLDLARKTGARTVPRPIAADGSRYTHQSIKQFELDVLSSHDRLWAAQRGVAMWDHVYGSIWA